MTWLLDSNVLISMVTRDHPRRERCLKWFAGIRSFATCPVTEGTLLRVHMQLAGAKSAAAAWRKLAAYHNHPRHTFWSESFSYTGIDPTRLTGHRQVTDSWLAALARRRGDQLTILDDALSALWPDSTFLIPV